MNFNDMMVPVGKPRERGKISLMGPPKRKPKEKSNRGSSVTSDLPWGKSHDSLFLNSSSSKGTTSTTDVDEDKIIVAITEGRGEARCEVGLAAVNVSRPVLILCQTSDSQSYTNTLTKLNILNPHLIIYPMTFETGKGNRLIPLLRKRFPNKKLVTAPRKSFNKTNGLDKLYKICIYDAFPLLMMIKSRYYALAAASGLLMYLQDNMYIYYASNSIKLEYQASEGYAIIDIATADRLELVCSTQPAQANRYSSLLGIMNRCLTRVGTRNLRSIILQPLYNKEKINERLNCVEELIRNPEVLLSIQGVLPKLSSVDQLLTLSTLIPEDPQRCSNRQLNYMLRLNGVLDTIQPLKEALKNTKQPFFLHLKEILENQDFDAIKKLIRETVHEEAYSGKGQQADQQRIWAIKPGLNGLLDLVRKTYSERIEDMREYIKKLGLKYDLPLTLANNAKKGYHIVLTLSQNQKRHMKSSEMPEEFIQVFRLANSFTMKTIELVNLSTRIDDILTDLFTLSNLMIHHIIVEIKEYSALFYKLVDGISYLDILQSLAEASYANRWIRPKFDEYTDVTFGRHPLLDFLCQKKPVSNPVAACEHYNLHIITGPNGAGKSIFIRQVMLLQIMAQTGCFVPAQTATFRPADKMFARISNDDDMESNASSFVLEMTEVNYILTTMTDRSLIIIDELCRSTAIEEGTAIAMFICEQLAKSKAFTFVTTHYTLLTKLAELFFNIKVWQLQTIPKGDPNCPKIMKLDFKFNLVSGATTLRGYGIYMVRGIWPLEVMKYVDELQENYQKRNKDPKFPRLDQRVRLRYDLDCKLQKLKLQNKFTLANLNKQLEEFNNEMMKIGADGVQYSQNLLQQVIESPVVLQDSACLNHSIFDASGVDEPSAEELSKIFLEDVTGSQESATVDYCMETENDRIDEENMALANSPSKAKERMLEIFTPDSKLDISQSTITSYTLISENLRPEIILSYNESQCSLNLTQEALELEDNRDQFCPETRKVIFLKPPQPEHNLVAESPFVSSFARPLQDDSRKTSTPMITKIEFDARNFGASTSPSTTTLSKKCLDVTHITTPKISFTIPQDVRDLDIASLAEDLESFAEEMKDDDYTSLDKEKEFCNQNIFPVVNVIQGPNFPSSEEDINISVQGTGSIIRPVVKNLQGNVDPMQYNESQKMEEVRCDNKEYRNLPSKERVVDVILPKNDNNEQTSQSKVHNDSYIEPMINSISHSEKCIFEEAVAVDKKITKPSKITENGTHKMIEAFSSLSNRSSEVVKHDEPKNAANLIVGVFSRLNINSPKNSPHKPMEPLADSKRTTEYQHSKDIEESIEEHNNISIADKNNIRKTEEINSRENETQIISNSNDEKIDKKKSEEDIPNRDKVNETSEDIYDTALSSEDDLSYSPLVATDSSKEIYESPDALSLSCTLQANATKIQDNVNCTAEAINKETERIEIVTDLPEVNLIHTDDSHNNTAVAHEAVHNEAPYNTSNITDTDFERTTQDFFSGEDHAEPNIDETQMDGILTKYDQVNDDIETIKKPIRILQNIKISKQVGDNDNVIEAIPKLDSTNLNADPDEISNKKLNSNPINIGLDQQINQSKRQVIDDEKDNNNSIKRIKMSPDKSASNHSTETKEKTRETTSISEASKLRNLEGNSSSSSNIEAQNERHNTSGCEKVNISSTSLSEASRKRNLDSATSSDKNPPASTKWKFKQQKRKKTFNAPLKKLKSLSSSNANETTMVIKNDSSASSERSIVNKFTNPSKLSQKAIREAFFEQDKKFFSSSGSSAELTKIWEERLKRPARPTPRQIQQTECLATIRKTNEGVEVIPTEKKPTKKKTLVSYGSSSVNMNIFSDRNAETFDQFIKSDKKDYKSFNFKFGPDVKNNDRGIMFDFSQIETASPEYTQNSKTWTFVRKRSDEFNLISQSNASSSLPFLSPTNDFSLTPEGYYKRHKEDIASLLKKYH